MTRNRHRQRQVRQQRFRSLRAETLEPRMLLAANAGEAAAFGYAFRLGAAAGESGAAIAADAAGNVYVAGSYGGTLDLDPGPGTVNRSGNAFVAKYTPTGALVWARSITGDIQYEGADIAVDGGGNVYLTGGYHGNVDFDPGAGTSYLNSGSNPAAFVLKLNSSGTFAWARSFAGGETGGLGVAVDGSGNVYTTGFFSGTADFNPGAGSSLLTSAGSFDAYVSKLDSSGNYVWAKRMGGGFPTSNSYDPGDRGYDIAVDGGGDVYTTGVFRGRVDFDPGPNEFFLTSSGNVGGEYYNDAYVWKLDTAGNFVWAGRLGGPAEGRSIAVDAQNNVYTAGDFYGTDADFDPGNGVYHVKSSGDKTVYVSKLSPTGDFVWASGLASGPVGPGNNPQVLLGLDNLGSAYIAAQFRGTINCDPGVGSTFNLTSAGGSDMFIARLDAQTGGLQWADAMGGPSDDQALGLAVDAAREVFTTGYFRGTADFGPGTTTHKLSSAGNVDVFVSKLTYYHVSQLTLSAGSSLPFGELTVTSDSPLAPASQLSARFSNASGYTVDVPVVSSTTNTATLVVPPYIDRASGQIQAGTVDVQLIQGGRVVAVGTAPLEVLALLDSSLPAGTITLGYLRSAAEEARAQQDALRWTMLDTADHNARLAAVADRLESLVGQVQGIVDTPTQTVNLGKVGTKDIVLDATAVAQMDRLLRTAISGEAALGVLPAASVGTLVQTQSTGTRITAAQELSAKFLAGEEPAPSVWSHYANVARTSIESLDQQDYQDISMFQVGLGGSLIGASLGGIAAVGAPAVAVVAPFVGAGLVLVAGGVLVQADLEQPGTIDALIDKTKTAMNAAGQEMARLAAAAQGAIGDFAQDVKSSYAAIQAASKTRPTGQVRISSVTAPVTYEDPAKPHAVYKVWLTNPPSSPITLNFDVDDGSEAEVTFGNQVIFGPSDWGPREVWVKGVDDTYADGDQPYSLGATIVSQDPDFHVTTMIADVLANIDNEPEMTISIQDASVVEGGSWQRPKAQIPVTLSTLSDKPITFRYHTMQASAKAGVDFVSVPWTTKTIPAGVQTVNVSVTTIGDDYVNSTDPLSFYVSIVPVSDIRGARPIAQVSINDDDVAGVVVQPLDTETSSLGDTGAFRVKLGSKPRATVQVGIRSDAPWEGKPNKTSLFFGPDTWSKWQTVTVKGQPGGDTAGDIEYHIVTSNAISKDAQYSGIDVDDVTMINHVAAPGVTIQVIDDDTSSTGGTGSFRARLNTKPSANVTIVLVSDNLVEGKVVKVVNAAGNVISSNQFIFTPANWSAWQTATVKGQPSGNEGLNPYTIVTLDTLSTDPKYNGLDVPDVPMVNHVVPDPGPYSVWIRILSGNIGVVDGKNPHRIQTDNGDFVGTYKDEAQGLVSLFGVDSRGIMDSIWWKTTGDWVFSSVFTVSGKALANGVVVYVSDTQPAAGAVAAAVSSLNTPSTIGQSDGSPSHSSDGLATEILAPARRRGLRPAAVDAILAEDF